MKKLKTPKKPAHQQVEEGNLLQCPGSPRGSGVVGFGVNEHSALHLRGAAMEMRERLTEAGTALSSSNKLLGALSLLLLGEEAVESIDNVCSSYPKESLNIGQRVASSVARRKTHDDEESTWMMMI